MRRRCQGSGAEPRTAVPPVTWGGSVRRAFSGIWCKKSVKVYSRAATICQTNRSGARKDKSKVRILRAKGQWPRVPVRWSAPEYAGRRPPSELVVRDAQTDEAIGCFLQLRLAGEPKMTGIAKNGEEIFLRGLGGLHELGPLDDLDAAGAAGGAAAREGDGCLCIVAHVDERSPLGDFDAQIVAEEVAFEEHGGHGQG